ncbi:hypothetical protein OH76DRAFT_661253 [Lentinus brumalis]|uniref:Transmembrane protein n=1 Tax=Lentinus brumalis TaxID=2498619 RepID=A0A371D7Q0_9APHY|nr:hypothetical protein OH76DRAFT_661253 [Polyporus brumalis]
MSYGLSPSLVDRRSIALCVSASSSITSSDALPSPLSSFRSAWRELLLFLLLMPLCSLFTLPLLPFASLFFLPLLPFFCAEGMKRCAFASSTRTKGTSYPTHVIV